MNKLQVEKPKLRSEFGVIRLALFGSYATNTQSENSDIDIFVETETANFMQLMALHEYLETLFNKKVDITRFGPHLSERFIKRVQQKLVYVD